MTQAINAPGFSILRGVQLTKEVAYLNMREAAAAAALSKLWSDTFLTDAGIAAGNSTGYTYRGSANYDVIQSLTYGADILPTDGTGGTASATHGSASIAGAADNNDSTWWGTPNGTLTGWIKWDLGSGVTKTVNKLTIKTHWDGAGNYFKNFTLEGSNDNSAWTTVYTGTKADDTTAEEFTFANSTAYRYYRLTCTAVSGTADKVILYECEMMEGAGSQAIVQSVRALDLSADVTSVIPFVDMTLNTGSLDLVEVSTDDGSTWTTVTPDEINSVPAGSQLKIRVTFSGDAELESWGIAA